MKRVK